MSSRDESTGAGGDARVDSTSPRSPLPRILRWGAPIALVALIGAGVWAVVFRDEPLPDETWWHEIPPPTLPRAGENPWQPLLDRWPTEEAMHTDLGVTGDDLWNATWALRVDKARDNAYRTHAEAAIALESMEGLEPLLGAREEANGLFGELEARGALSDRSGSSWPASFDDDPAIVLFYLCEWICMSSWASGETGAVPRTVRISLYHCLDRATSESPSRIPSGRFALSTNKLVHWFWLFEQYCSLGLFDSELDEWADTLAALPLGDRLWELQVRETYRVARCAMTDPAVRRELFNLWSKHGVVPGFPSAGAARGDPIRLKPHYALRRTGEYCRSCLGHPRRPAGNLPPRVPNSRIARVVLDPFGDVLVEQLVSWLSLVWEELGKYEEARDAAEILVALRRHLRDHGKLPPSLDALVPAYLASVPIDPIVGGPWKYDPVRGRFWCGAVDPDARERTYPWYRPSGGVHQAVPDPAAETRER